MEPFPCIHCIDFSDFKSGKHQAAVPESLQDINSQVLFLTCCLKISGEQSMVMYICNNFPR